MATPTILENQHRFYYSGTKEEFIAAGRPALADANGLTVWIKDEAHGGAGSCIYMAGMYFADFKTLMATVLAALNYFKGVKVNGEMYNALAGGGYLSVEAADPATVDITVGQDGVKIGLSATFVNKLNTVVNDVANIAKDYLKAADKEDLQLLIGNAKAEAISTVVGNASSDTADSLTIQGTRKYVDAQIADAAGDVADLAGRVTTLEGADAGKSVRGIVQDELVKQLESEGISDSFDTLKEIAEWLSSHPDDVTEMNNAIAANTAAIALLNGDGAGSVNKKIADAIAAEKSRADQAYDAKGAAAQALTDAKTYTNQQIEALSGDYYTKEQVRSMFKIGSLD